MPKPKKRLKWVDDKPVVIPVNWISQLLVTIALGVVFALFAGGALFFMPTSQRDRFTVILAVCGFGVIFAIWLGIFVRSLILKPRLSIDLTAVRLLHGGGKVVGQLPYENMASVRVDLRQRSSGRRTVDYKVLEIALIKRKDPDTW